MTTTNETWRVGDRAEVEGHAGTVVTYDDAIAARGWGSRQPGWLAVRFDDGHGPMGDPFHSFDPSDVWNVRRPSVPDVASAMDALVRAVGKHGPHTHEVSAAYLATGTGTREAHSRLHAAVGACPASEVPPEVRGAWDAATEALRAAEREAHPILVSAPSPDVREWRVGDECEVRPGSPINGERRWWPAVVTRVDEHGNVGGDYHVSPLGGSDTWYMGQPDPDFLRRPLTKPSADRTPAPAGAREDGDRIVVTSETPDGWSGGTVIGGPAAKASRWNTTCRCGAPAYESLLSRECSLGSTCPVVAGEPEPARVDRTLLWQNGDGRALGDDHAEVEHGWCAEGWKPGTNEYITATHPTEAGAVALWRERVRGGR